MAGCARGTSIGLIHLHQAPSALIFMSLGEAGDWMPLRGSFSKRIWRGFALMKKGISWLDLYHMARSIVTFGKINWKISKMTGLSTKIWLLMGSFYRKVVSPPLFQILKLCGAVRVGASPLHFSRALLFLSAGFCHSSVKIKKSLHLCLQLPTFQS